MENVVFWLLLMVLSFIGALVMQKLFGVVGLYVWSAALIVIANILVTITVALFGVTTTLGNAPYGGSYLVTDALSEREGKAAARKAVWVGFVTQIAFLLFIQIGIAVMPAPSDWAQPHIAALFSLLPRIVLGSLIAYVISQLHDVWLFERIRAVLSGRKMLWVRNNVSTVVSQFIDTAIFCTIAFWGVFETGVFFQILVSTFVLKVVVAVCDTPFVYWLTSSRWGKIAGEKSAT